VKASGPLPPTVRIVAGPGAIDVLLEDLAPRSACGRMESVPARLADTDLAQGAMPAMPREPIAAAVAFLLAPPGYRSDALEILPPLTESTRDAVLIVSMR